MKLISLLIGYSVVVMFQTASYYSGGCHTHERSWLYAAADWAVARRQPQPQPQQQHYLTNSNMTQSPASNELSSVAFIFVFESMVSVWRLHRSLCKERELCSRRPWKCLSIHSVNQWDTWKLIRVQVRDAWAVCVWVCLNYNFWLLQ